MTIELGLRAGAWTESRPGTASMALGMLVGPANELRADLEQIAPVTVVTSTSQKAPVSQ